MVGAGTEIEEEVQSEGRGLVFDFNGSEGDVLCVFAKGESVGQLVCNIAGEARLDGAGLATAVTVIEVAIFARFVGNGPKAVSANIIKT